MKIYEVHRSPEVDTGLIDRFCVDAQILLKKLEEAQESGVSLNEDYARSALILVESYGFPLVFNHPVGVDATIGFCLMKKMFRKNTDIVYEALFLPRANYAIMPYLGKKFLDNTEKFKLLHCRNSADTEVWQNSLQEIQETIAWLGGNIVITGAEEDPLIHVKLSSWEREHQYHQNDFSLLCFGVERHIRGSRVAFEDDSTKARLWKRYLGLKECFESNTFLKEKCHTSCDLCYYGSFVAVEQTNSVPTQQIGCVDFSDKGMDQLSRLLNEVETISH